MKRSVELVERTSGDGDGDDFINATTVAAEPFDIDGALLKPFGTSPPAMRSEDTVLLKVILLNREVAQHVQPM